MATKLYDLAVKIGSYKDRSGQEKGQWQRVGAVMQNDDGGKFIMLERWFNPAGVPNPDNRSNLLLSMFEPRQYDDDGGQQRGNGGGQRQQSSQQQRRQAPPTDNGFSNQDDDIPF